MKRSRQFFFLFLLIFTVCTYTTAGRTIDAAETPSGDNTDGGSISLDIVHHQALSLTLQLNNDHLAYQDVTLDCEDAATGKPITISLLAAPGTSEYTLYDLENPVEKLTGTLNISMITEPGYRLNLENTLFTVNGQTYGSGSVAIIDTPSASVNSAVSCQEQETNIPETPAGLEPPAQPQNPTSSVSPAEAESSAQVQNFNTTPESAIPAQAEPDTIPQTAVSSGTAAEISQTEPRETTAPELLMTTPIENSAVVSAAVPADDFPAAGVPDTTAAPVPSAVTHTTPETTSAHNSDIKDRILLTAQLFFLVFVILIFIKLGLILKRESRKRQYGHSR